MKIDYERIKNRLFYAVWTLDIMTAASNSLQTEFLIYEGPEKNE